MFLCVLGAAVLGYGIYGMWDTFSPAGRHSGAGIGGVVVFFIIMFVGLVIAVFESCTYLCHRQDQE